MSGRLQHGLTLWEVLAAASGMLLLALAGSFLPVFRYREINHRRLCRSNAKILVTAALMYVDDYDGRLPPADHVAIGGQLHTLPSYLDPYIKNGDAWCCPELLRRRDKNCRFDGIPGDTTVSYGYNWLALAPHGRGIQLDQVQNPEETVLFAETTSYRASPARLASTRSGTVPIYVHQHQCTVAWLNGRTSYSPRLELEHSSTSEGRQAADVGIDAYRYWDLK